MTEINVCKTIRQKIYVAFYNMNCSKCSNVWIWTSTITWVSLFWHQQTDIEFSMFQLPPSKHLLVFKTFWRRFQDMSWRRLQRVFSVTILHLPRRLEDVLKKFSRRIAKTAWRRFQDLSQDVLKTSWKTKNCYAEDVFQTSWRHALKTSWRHYWYKQNTFWGYLYRGNLNVYLTNLYFTNLYLTILMRIQNALIRTQ